MNWDKLIKGGRERVCVKFAEIKETKNEHRNFVNGTAAWDYYLKWKPSIRGGKIQCECVQRIIIKYEWNWNIFCLICSYCYYYDWVFTNPDDYASKVTERCASSFCVSANIRLAIKSLSLQSPALSFYLVHVFDIFFLLFYHFLCLFAACSFTLLPCTLYIVLSLILSPYELLCKFAICPKYSEWKIDR